LLLLYVNDIVNCALDACIKLAADDTNVFLHGKSVEDTISKANNILSHLSAWFCANKLSLSINKTSYSIFGKHANDQHNTTNPLYIYVIMTYKRLTAANILVFMLIILYSGKIMMNIYIKSY